MPLLVVSLGGCGGDDLVGRTVRVSATAWGGAGPSAGPGPVGERTLEVDDGRSTSVPCAGFGDLELTVTGVGEDVVELETGLQMAPESETGGINLNATTRSFEVSPGQRLRFSTPTLDAGCSYTVEIAD